MSTLEELNQVLSNQTKERLFQLKKNKSLNGRAG